MSDYKAYFDGHDLSTLFKIAPPERNLVTWEPDLAQMPSGYGSLFMGTKAQSMEIKLTLTTLAETQRERQDALRTLAGWLFVTEPKRLYLTDERIPLQGGYIHGYLYREAVPTGTPSVTYTLNAATAKVTFICPDARGYVSAQIGTQTAGASISTSGNDPTEVVAEGTAPTATRLWIRGKGDANGDIEFTVTCYQDESGSAVMPDLGGTFKLQNVFEKCDIIVFSETREYEFGPVESGTEDLPLPLGNDWIWITGGHRTVVQLTKGEADFAYITYVTRWW